MAGPRSPVAGWPWLYTLEYTCLVEGDIQHKDCGRLKAFHMQSWARRYVLADPSAGEELGHWSFTGGGLSPQRIVLVAALWLLF